MLELILESILFIVSIFLFRKMGSCKIKHDTDGHLIYRCVRLLSGGFLVFIFFMGISIMDSNLMAFIVSFICALMIYIAYLYILKGGLEL